MPDRRSSRAEAVRALLRDQRSGVLSTASARHDGAPFGSLASYVLDAHGAPLFLFSSLAQHTKNLAADPRASFLVQDVVALANEDPQSVPRACLVGRAEPVPEADVADARARYVARWPHAQEWLQLDFTLWRLRVDAIHYVGGFAQAAWMEAAEVLD
jgi:putative heme iron utilization protein